MVSTGFPVASGSSWKLQASPGQGLMFSLAQGNSEEQGICPGRQGGWNAHSLGGGLRVQGQLWDGTCKPQQESTRLRLKMHKEEKQIPYIIHTGPWGAPLCRHLVQSPPISRLN